MVAAGGGGQREAVVEKTAKRRFSGHKQNRKLVFKFSAGFLTLLIFFQDLSSECYVIQWKKMHCSV
jgi:hypothetical protein